MYGEKVSSILDTMIQIVLDGNKNFDDIRQHLKQNRTIKFALPRGSGHTYAIKKLMDKYDRSIVIAPNSELLKLHYNNYNSISILSNDIEGFHFDKYDIVFVDCCALLKHNHLKKLYNQITNRNVVIILIQ